MSCAEWTKPSTRSKPSDSVPIVAEADLRALLERHVELFNEAVSTGDYNPFLATFADNAVMRFDDFPLGPFVGRPAIAEAYANQPPTDTMALIDMEEIGTDAVKASFEWDAGGTGQMYLRWNKTQLVELSIALSEPSAG
jgi:steroid Delta-isomerase